MECVKCDVDTINVLQCRGCVPDCRHCSAQFISQISDGAKAAQRRCSLPAQLSLALLSMTVRSKRLSSPTLVCDTSYLLHFYMSASVFFRSR